MDFRIIDKYFSIEDNLFHIIKEKKYTFEREEKTYALFDQFYRALNKNLANADLLDYDFQGVDISKYILAKAKVSSEIMIKLGIYNNTLYKSLTKDNHLANIMPSTSLDLVPSRYSNFEEFEEGNVVVCYISDLHLNHKILNKFKNNINKFELDSYFRKVVEKLKNSLPTFTRDYIIVFVGDISYNFDVFKLFFKFYRKEIPYQKTFVILGNHELWDTKLNKNCKTVEEIIANYRMFLNSFENKIYLLENQLFLPNDRHIYSQEEILNLDKNTLRQKFLRNSYAIFGGIGYAGKNEKFNANQGIYRTQYITREQEKERSNQVDALHRKLTEIASDKKVFFITHMPKEDWSKSDYNKNWFYISGHTHKNKYIENETLKVYADNQVGYLNDSYGFKYLMTTKEFDIFQDYKDGIYEITKEQYKLFYFGVGNNIDFNRNFEKLFMLKRNGIYCFLIKMNNSNDLKLLNGGNIKNVGKHDINYFYENLVNYSNSVKLFLKAYENFQRQISNEIKKIGGSGYIHGCIIDIDFYNHLYVNPLDAKITPYFALSIIDKYVYTNLISLLKAHNKDLYENYIKLLEYGSNNKNLIIFNNNLQESNKKEFVPETDMYRISRVLKGFQYTTKNNIVRLWNDTIVSNSTKESGRLIVSGLLNPEEMKKIQAKQRKIEKQQHNIEYKKEKQNEKQSVTKEEKKKILFDKYSSKLSTLNKNLKVVSYYGAKEKAEYECLICGYKWSYRPDHFSEKYKYKCPKCKN